MIKINVVLSIRSHVRTVLFFFLTYYTCFSEKTTCFLSATKLQATVIFNLDPFPLPVFLPSCFFLFSLHVCEAQKNQVHWFNHDKKKKKKEEDYKAFQVTCLASLPLFLVPDSFLSTDDTPCPLRDLGTWQPSWPSLRSPIGAVTTHSALFVSPQTTWDLENKQWGQCHRYIMMSLNLASHSKAWRQTQRDTRKRFILLKK